MTMEAAGKITVYRNPLDVSISQFVKSWGSIGFTVQVESDKYFKEGYFKSKYTPKVMEVDSVWGMGSELDYTTEADLQKMQWQDANIWALLEFVQCNIHRTAFRDTEINKFACRGTRSQTGEFPLVVIGEGQVCLTITPNISDDTGVVFVRPL